MARVGARTAEPAGADDPRPGRTPARYGWFSIGVAILFGLLYAYSLFSAITNVVALSTDIATKNNLRTAVGTDLISMPWPLLVIDLIAPVIIFMLAFVLGRRRAVGVRAALFALGFVALCAVTLSLTALVQNIVPVA